MTTDELSDPPSTVDEPKIIPNLMSGLSHDTLTIVYHLVLRRSMGCCSFALGVVGFSIAYALGLGVLDAQWHKINDANAEEMLKDEECREHRA